MMIINGFGAIIWRMYIMLGQICGQGVGVMKISSDLTITFQAKILPDDIHRTNQFHAHPYYNHLLTCLDDDNQWFWGYHLAHVHHAGSDFWSGLD
jgi:hypothetical protein